ncbi:MAG: prolyl oligopeptidase family serine peptidase [Bacteroidales bacterium]|nr:prolyl oligopeptidase family serine peptidase [Bacteroidales bacterium]
MKNGLVCLLIGFCLLSLSSLGQQPDTTLFEAHVYVEGNDTLPYRLYRSQKVCAAMETARMTKADTMTKALPLVIFLHGAGERGNDNVAQLTHCVRFFLDDTVTSRYPFLLMVPQCPEGKRWVNTDWSLPEHRTEPEPTTEMQSVFALTDSLIDSGIVDAQHVYICGISMGGFGVWDALQRQPQRFAAAIAICGGGDPACAEAIKNLPIYIFHGMRDGVVMPSRSTQMYDALKKAGNSKAVLVTYPDLGHECWDRAFSTPGIFQWLFDQQSGPKTPSAEP